MIESRSVAAGERDGVASTYNLKSEAMNNT